MPNSYLNKIAFICLPMLFQCSSHDEWKSPYEYDPAPVSFVVFGDWGVGNVIQWSVSLDIKDYCEQNECEFIFTLGDNFYDDGIQIVDEQWQTKYERMYGHFDIPFYAILGNHDMEGDPYAQIYHHEVDPSWNMPGEYYSIAYPSGSETPFIEIFAVNSENLNVKTKNWLDASLTSSRAIWKILATHTPFITNSYHLRDSDRVRDELLSLVCNRVDLVISGHEHLFSHLRKDFDGCNIEQLIVGTGGAHLFTPEAPDSSLVYTASIHGFGWFSVTANKISFRMMETARIMNYDTSWEK